MTKSKFGHWQGQSSFARFATTGERRVARKLVKALLDRGYVVSVNDGYEWTVKQTGHLKTVLDALCTTGEDRLSFRVAGSDVSGGTFLLIWGNEESGEELIADHSDNETTAAIYREVMGEIEE